MAAVTEPKEFGSEDRLRIFYAGVVSIEKGVGDCVDACALLSGRGVLIHLTVAGSGDVETLRQRAASAGVESQVRFLGPVASEGVRAMMRDHDVVVVPSRYEFAEGLPNTIYEALASRTPLVASDHPAFADRLSVDRGSLQFRAADPDSLAEQFVRLAADRELYRSVSEASASVLASLYVGTEWTELVREFLDDPEDLSGWVKTRSLVAVESRTSKSVPPQ